MIGLAVALITTTQEPTWFAWSKELQPGITYRQEIDLNVPIVIHSLRIKFPQEGFKLIPAIANDKLKVGGESGAMTSVPEMAKAAGAFAAINADFFYSGDPLGMLLMDGQLLSEPLAPRAVMGWNDFFVRFDGPDWKGSIILSDGTEIKISGLNRLAGNPDLVLFTPKSDRAVSREPSTMVVFSGEMPPLNGESTLTFKRIVSDETSLKIEPGEMVICATDTRIRPLLYNAESGATAKITLRISGSLDWSSIKHAVSGGPRLVRNGIALTDFSAEKFDNNFTNNRHPRTGIGLSKEGDLIMVVVDGRSPISRGMTLVEFADQLLKLGCVDAINLDGGGSSTLYLSGSVINRPSDGKDRLVGNALLLIAPEFAKAVGSLKIVANTQSLKPGDATTLKLLDQVGQPIPNDEVFWVCDGRACWIDQGGKLRALEPGAISVRAVARGAEGRLTFTVKKPEKQPATGTPPPTRS